MRLLVILFFFPLSVFGQINIVDLSTEQSEKVTKYDSSYFIPDYKFSNSDVMRGLVGYRLVFLKKPSDCKYFHDGIERKYYEIKDEMYLFKAAEVIGVIGNGEYSSKFILKCNGDSLVYKPLSIDELIIQEGFELYQSKCANATFYSLSNDDVHSSDDQIISMSVDTPIKLIDVSIGKLSSFSFGLLYNFEYNNTKFRMSMELSDLNSGLNVGNPDGKMVFVTDYLYHFKIIDSNLYSTVKKSLYKANIYRSQVVVGMSENEILLSWGIPDRHADIVGYDYVSVYGSRYVYVKNKKCIKLSGI